MYLAAEMENVRAIAKRDADSARLYAVQKFAKQVGLSYSKVFSFLFSSFLVSLDAAQIRCDEAVTLPHNFLTLKFGERASRILTM